MRQNRLALLSAPQELFVETLVSNGIVHCLKMQGRDIGYAVTSADDQLVEFYLDDAHVTLAGRALDAVSQQLGAKTILAQSFDPLLTFLGLRTNTAGETRGLLYRVIADSDFEARDDVLVAPARETDVSELASLSDDFFDDEQEIMTYLAADGLFVYRDIGSNILGAGVLKPVIQGTDAIDVGMVVAPQHRGHGYGSYIVRHLKAHCLAKRWRPICGCYIDNIASQRTLERAGFASMHCLVEFAIHREDALKS